MKNEAPKEGGTAVNCREKGHCWHIGMAVGSRVCCKCGVTEYTFDYTLYLISPDHTTPSRISP